MAWGRGKGLEKPQWGGGGVQGQIEQVLGSGRAQLRVEAMICGFGLCGASDDWGIHHLFNREKMNRSKGVECSLTLKNEPGRH